ncbi:type IV pili methyl-accepting chemotaxis transducer N-terminal domain-containing protein [Burkholderia ubonensis]|uniref:type IV pili methyl-accepting chemotaxis transducer N-terminal domain-containing protein n=1 Tax=Burkholderia ubonensis TaxID=101571 RepID=UPI00075208D2|nr:type IV pili methyl-accepting chemotaxis transducer N-terminal domain-containing protein [Burkholderia ubonensis]KVZ52522.1 histidine kinase [Burkholderia ubonensis]
MQPTDHPPGAPLRHRLSTRIVALSAGALALVLAMIGGTLWLSWQLEGAGAAINDAGSLRMRATRVYVDLDQYRRTGRAQALDSEFAAIDGTLARLRRGDPSRPLFLPATEPIRRQLDAVAARWTSGLKPLAAAAARPAAPDALRTAYADALPAFIDDADRLVGEIERDNARKTTLLRLSQAGLGMLACAGAVAAVYLLYLWIILPVIRLRDGLTRIASREFGARLSVDTRDEFGDLARGFNRMANELQEAYAGLEARVQEKTAQLASQNRELAALYETAAFLNRPQTVDDMCRGFLQRAIRQFDADSGTIRVTAPDGKKLHLVSAEGFPEALADAERCMPVGDCHCGAAARDETAVLRDMRGSATPCAREGLMGVAVFRIVTQDATLGTFSLHFRDASRLPAAERRVLDTLGRHLGIALDHARLSASARQLAVAEERNLVAQGLHDSIAQSLNFVNLQAQMLADAIAHDHLADAREILPMLRQGIEQSYADVRELLVNFRTRLSHGELRAAIAETVARFESQTGIDTTLDDRDDGGAPLPPDQQLQVLFILQEALSNVRKHARARHVAVTVENGAAFRLHVADDGCGYDPAALDAHGHTQVGLAIMRERAARLRATLTLSGAPGQGARVDLSLPADMRQTA